MYPYLFINPMKPCSTTRPTPMGVGVFERIFETVQVYKLKRILQKKYEFKRIYTNLQKFQAAQVQRSLLQNNTISCSSAHIDRVGWVVLNGIYMNSQEFGPIKNLYELVQDSTSAYGYVTSVNEWNKCSRVWTGIRSIIFRQNFWKNSYVQIFDG